MGGRGHRAEDDAGHDHARDVAGRADGERAGEEAECDEDGEQPGHRLLADDELVGEPRRGGHEREDPDQRHRDAGEHGRAEAQPEEASADERGEDEGHCADGLDDRDRPEPEGDDVEHRDQAHEAETGDPGGAASESGRQGGHGMPLQVSAQRQAEGGGGCEDDGGDDHGRHTKEEVGAGT